MWWVRMRSRVGKVITTEPICKITFPIIKECRHSKVTLNLTPRWVLQIQHASTQILNLYLCPLSHPCFAIIYTSFFYLSSTQFSTHASPCSPPFLTYQFSIYLTKPRKERFWAFVGFGFALVTSIKHNLILGVRQWSWKSVRFIYIQTQTTQERNIPLSLSLTPPSPDTYRVVRVFQTSPTSKRKPCIHQIHYNIHFPNFYCSNW